MNPRLALDQGVHRLVGQRFPGTRKGRTNESLVIRAERAVIVLFGQRDALGSKCLLISSHLNWLVIDDDAVEIKKDGLNHEAAPKLKANSRIVQKEPAIVKAVPASGKSESQAKG